jgi:hypothetical protein
MKVILCALALVFNAYAGDVKTEFDKKFKIVEIDGKPVAVKMKMFSGGLKLKPYLMELKRQIKEELLRLDQKGADQLVEEFAMEIRDEEKNDDVERNLAIFADALNNLKSVDIDEAFAQVENEGVFDFYERDFNRFLLNFDLSIIANLEDSRFFYKRAVTYEVVTRALEFAKKRFSDVPLLNLASMIIVKVHDMIVEQRMFHQNMLLYYLERQENKLPFSHDEVNYLFSSIYESRIGAMNFMESNRAAQTWLTYGTDSFFGVVRGVNTKIRQFYPVTADVFERLSFGFVEVMEDGKRVIKNMIDTKHMFSMKPATAYYIDEPNKVKRTRALINLGQVALGFLPINGEIKGFADNFLASMHEKQRITEGALLAYFAVNDNEKMFSEIKKQNINPYIIW